jgi:AsmA family/AsmA-like C-terminal region
VQTTLLGLAIAIILALVSAIVAPLVVDWNHYRAPIEAEASRLTGLDVRVNGAIDARLLPSPEITLHDVDVGGAGRPALMRAGELKLELALPPLLRGQVQAIQADLIKPEISLALKRSGALDLPALAPSFHPQMLSISHFSVTDGRVTLIDTVSGRRLALQKLWFNGDIASFAGPFNGQGAAMVGDQLYAYRISGDAADGGGNRIRLGIDPSNIPLTTLFDGKLTFADGVPHFDGALSLARPVGAALANGERVVSEPWRATAAVKATPASAAISSLTFRYGPEERAINLTGSADLTFGAHPQLTGSLAAMQIDVDRALAAPELTDRPPLVLLRSFLAGFVAAAKLPVPAQIGLRVDALTIGGTSLDSLAGQLNFDGSAWSLTQFQFHAPGLTDVSLSGRLSDSGRNFTFSGPASLASADFEVLLNWLDGNGGGRLSGDAKTFTARGNVTVASDRMGVEQLRAALNQEKIAGSLAYEWPAGHHPSRLDAELHADELNLDAFSAFAKTAFANSASAGGFALPQDAALALDVGKVTFAGVDAHAVAAQVKLDAGRLQIDRLSIGDLAGAKLAIGGGIDDLTSQPRGQITLDLNASALDGLGDVAAKFVPQDADTLHRLAAQLAPAQVHAVLDVGKAASAGSAAELKVSGTLAAMQLAIDGKASGEPAHLDSAALQIDTRIDTDDGAALVALLGLDRVLAVDQLPGRLTLTAAGPLNGDIQVSARMAASGLDSTLAGTVRLAGKQAPQASLQVQAAAGDLRPLQQALTGQKGSAVPVSAHAALSADGAKLNFTNIAATVGKSSLHGNLAVDWAIPIGVTGSIEADNVDAPSVTALLLGLPTHIQGSGSAPNTPDPPAAAAPWSNQPLGPGAFAGINGAVKFKFDHAALTSGLIVQNFDGVAHFSPSSIIVDGIDGSLAGGRLSGSLSFTRNGDGLSAHTKIDLADAAAAAIAGPPFNASGGTLTLRLTSDGFGASPAALISSQHGKGTAALENVAFAGLDPGVFGAARQAAGQTGPVDAGKVKEAVNAALANGHFAVPQADVPYTIASGAIELDHVTLGAASGPQLSLNGSIDLVNEAIDARTTLSEAPPADALITARPELSVDIKGPIASPQRTLDMSALTSWLTLSAAELQTRRIEMMEAAQRPSAVEQDTHPAPPEAHSLSPGTVVETAMPPNLLTPPGGGRGIEHLQPQPQPPVPSLVPGQIKPPNQRRSGPQQAGPGAPAAE